MFQLAVDMLEETRRRKRVLQRKYREEMEEEIAEQRRLAAAERKAAFAERRLERQKKAAEEAEAMKASEQNFLNSFNDVKTALVTVGERMLGSLVKFVENRERRRRLAVQSVIPVLMASGYLDLSSESSSDDSSSDESSSDESSSDDSSSDTSSDE
jgi:hypothetical protein